MTLDIKSHQTALAELATAFGVITKRHLKISKPQDASQWQKSQNLTVKIATTLGLYPKLQLVSLRILRDQCEQLQNTVTALASLKNSISADGIDFWNRHKANLLSLADIIADSIIEKEDSILENEPASILEPFQSAQ